MRTSSLSATHRPNPREIQYLDRQSNSLRVPQESNRRNLAPLNNLLPPLHQRLPLLHTRRSSHRHLGRMSTLPPLLAGNPRPRPNLPNRLREPHHNGHLRCNNRPPPHRLPSPHNPASNHAPQTQTRLGSPLLRLPPPSRYNQLPRPISDITPRFPTIPLPHRISRNPSRNSRLKRPCHRLFRSRSRNQETQIQTRSGLCLCLGING